MIKNPVKITGSLQEKVKKLLECAGWYEGRSVDISIVEKHYQKYGLEMMKTTKRFYKKYFGLCSEWYFTDRSIKRENYFEFGLFPYLQNGIKDNLEEAVFRDMITRGKEEVEKIAGQNCQPLGVIGYIYPAEVWISEYGKLYAQYEYRDAILCFDNIYSLIEEDLKKIDIEYVTMRTLKILDKM